METEYPTRVEILDRHVHLSFSTWSRLLASMQRRVPSGDWTADEEVRLLLDVYERNHLDRYYASDARPCTCHVPPEPTNSGMMCGRTEE